MISVSFHFEAFLADCLNKDERTIYGGIVVWSNMQGQEKEKSGIEVIDIVINKSLPLPESAKEHISGFSCHTQMRHLKLPMSSNKGTC